MTDKADDGRGGENKPAEALSDEEVEAVAERRAGSARVVHEVVRLQGDEELSRPGMSLLLSGFAAGLSITASVMAESFLRLRLPPGPPYELVSRLGYSFGFIIVILGNLQLFTESTVTAVLPLATHPTWRNLWRLVRLWGIVLSANLGGTLLVSVMMAHVVILSPEQLNQALAVAAPLMEHDARRTFLLGIPAGFLVGTIAWILPNARANDFWIILVITYVIAIGGFSHVVAGSSEAWLLWLAGKASLGWAVGGFMLPALAGNILGGTGLFAVLAHGQVRGEIHRPRED